MVAPFGNLDALVDADCVKEVNDIIQSVHPIKRTDYLHIYLQRIYLTNAVLFKKATWLIATLLEVDQEIQQRADQFAGLFGMMQQVVNDNADWVPSRFQESTVEKGCGDVFCDLNNKIVTMPTIIHFERNTDGKILAQYEGHKGMLFTQEMEEELFDEIAKDYSIYYSMAVGKQLKKLLMQYSFKKAFIADLCGFADNNKYYKHFYNMKIYYDNYKKNKRYNQNE
ncbi:MAG: polyprenyl synthetase family protein [Saprospiraceae bacterium]|nr:polyprenyl synthetase family protein [Saprospiraceae bacterium]